MKKAIILLAVLLSSCSTPNVYTNKDNPDIPVVITQLAESKRELLQKDTLDITSYESFEDKHYLYQYKITKQKAELERKIALESEVGIIFFIGMSVGFLVIFAIGAILD